MTDVIVIGGGAAGLFCAGEIAKRGKSVVVLEHNSKPGKKIRISGGGRCNFTNREVTHQNFLSENPNFARSALQRYTPQDFITLIESYNISWHEKKLGQLFCDSSAQQIIDMLVHRCLSNNAQIHYGQSVQHIEKITDYHFKITTTAHQLECASVVVASGGLSIPTLGATDIGYRIAQSFLLPIIPTKPALVPILFSNEAKNKYGALSGLSIETVARVNKLGFRENILFTHRGLSGPAILQTSSYATESQPITIDVIPDINSIEMLFEANGVDKRKLRNSLTDILPERFVATLPQELLETPVNQTRKTVKEQIYADLKYWQVIPNGTEGYAKAEVTKGGVDTKVLSSKTMECVQVAGLYFIGEVVDVTGWLGGYNFQWAWSSAYAASEGISARV